MAFRRSALLKVGGCDPQFRAAGDDVDLCWRIQEAGGTLGFSPAAVVWHHRRDRLRTYLKQQAGYGRAEAMLERKWPEKYNTSGHVRWAGRLYGRGLAEPLVARTWRVYYGTWGSRSFQPLYSPADGTLAALALMPEWYLLVAVLGALAALSPLWSPLLAALPLLGLALAVVAVRAARAARRAEFPTAGRSRAALLGLRGLTALLHVLQPLSRLYGRLGEGLAVWRPCVPRADRGLPLPRQDVLWSEDWQAPDDRLRDLEIALLAGDARPVRGGDYDRWDLEVRGGALGAARARLLVEEHGAGRQLARLRSWARCTPAAVALFAGLTVLALLAVGGGAIGASVAFALAALLVAARTADEAARATSALRRPLSAEQPAAVRAAPRAPLSARVPVRDEA